MPEDTDNKKVNRVDLKKVCEDNKNVYKVNGSNVLFHRFEKNISKQKSSNDIKQKNNCKTTTKEPVLEQKNVDPELKLLDKKGLDNTEEPKCHTTLKRSNSEHNTLSSTKCKLGKKYGIGFKGFFGDFDDDQDIEQIDDKKNQQKKKVGRPASKNSGYIVTVHKTGSYSYLSVQRKKNHNGRRYYCHFHLGPLNEDNEFVPGKNYLFASAEFKRNLIFPKFVKMNVLKELNSIYIKNQTILSNSEENENENEKVKENEFEFA